MEPIQKQTQLDEIKYFLLNQKIQVNIFSFNFLNIFSKITIQFILKNYDFTEKEAHK